MGAPQTRFDDVHVDFQTGKDWVELVHNDKWSMNFKEFALFAHKSVKAPIPVCLQPKQVAFDHVEEFKSEPRPPHLWKREKPWLVRDDGSSICFFGDNLQTVQWINGLWKIKNNRWCGRIAWFQRSLSGVFFHHKCTPSAPFTNWFFHIFREQNTTADALANEGQMGNNGIEAHVENYKARHWKYLAGFWDGALKTGDATGGCGAWIGWCNHLDDGRPQWETLLSWRGSMVEGKSALNCEMAAAFVMVYIMKHCVVGGMAVRDFPLTIIDVFLMDANFRNMWLDQLWLWPANHFLL